MRIFFLVCSFCLAFVAKSQWIQSQPYTQVTQYSSYSADALSGNPASLASIKSLSAVIYGERRFMLDDMGSYKLGMALPTVAGSFAIDINRFGSHLYAESQIGLAYSRRMQRFDVGARFNYVQSKIMGYGNASTVYFDLGAIMQITDRFRAGVHLANPTGNGFGKFNSLDLPVVYSAGFGFDVSKKFLLRFDIRKEEADLASLDMGMEYRFDERLFVRSGISTGVTNLYFGTGFSFGRLRIDATASVHQYLGITPGLMISYKAPEKK